MFTDGTVDSTDYEQRVQSELDPLIQRDEKGPTVKEERVARAQFLALCWALFVVGWTDGSTGALLPRIQIFYDVSFNLAFLSILTVLTYPTLQVGFGTVSWVFILQCIVSDVLLRPTKT